MAGNEFLVVYCKSSGTVRRFSVGTDAGFALQLINKKLAPEVPLALHIEAVKEGEEPISFGPNSVLIDYGHGWKLQTVTDEAFPEKQKDMDLNLQEEFPNFELAKDNIGFLTDGQYQIEDPLQEVEKPIASELISDIESHSEKSDLTDIFRTDMVFNSRDELLKWTRDVGRSVGTVIVIKCSDYSRRTGRIYFGCQRGGKYKESLKKGVRERTRMVTTKKCDCPFTLRGVKMENADEWRVRVDCGFHNHPVARPQSPEEYPCRKLTSEEESIVLELSNSGKKAKEIVSVLKERNEEDATRISVRAIYNFRKKMKLVAKKPGRCQGEEDDCNHQPSTST